MHDRPVHCVRPAESAEQERSAMAVRHSVQISWTRAMLSRASSDSATAPTGRCRFMPHSLRSAANPECISAEIDRACARRGAVVRP